MWLLSAVVCVAVLAGAVVKPLRNWRRRMAAIKAYGAAEVDLRREGLEPTDEQIKERAVALMGILYSGLSIFQRRRYIDWASAATSTGVFADAPRSGRKPKLSEADGLRVIAELRKGFFVDGKLRPFPDVQTAQEHNPEIARILGKAGYKKPCDALDRLQAIDKELKHLKVHVIPQMSAQLLRERVLTCYWLASQSLDYFKRVWWMDCKTLHCHPKAGYALAHKEDTDLRFVEDPRMKSNDDVIKFYAVANWHYGIAMWWFCQGTTGLPLRFKVSNKFTHEVAQSMTDWTV